MTIRGKCERALAGGAMLVILAGVAMPAAGRQQTVPSREAIALEVIVSAADGTPVRDLEAAAFEVTIDGRKHTVVSADFVETTEGRSIELPAAARSNALPVDGPGRIVVLAIDLTSFGAAETTRIRQLGQELVDRLPRNAAIGVYALGPYGLWLDPTMDRARVSRALGSLVGQRKQLVARFTLTPIEAADIVAETRGSIDPGFGVSALDALPRRALPGDDFSVWNRVASRECVRGGDTRCASALVHESVELVEELDRRASWMLDELRRALTRLRDVPGRKTVVLIGAGVPISDVSGGRLDVRAQSRRAADLAALAAATIYALQVSVEPGLAFGASVGRIDSGDTVDREQRLASRLVEGLTDATGGARFDVTGALGGRAIGRVIGETSGYYVVRVGPGMRDDKARAHEVRVTVSRPNVIVRTRPRASFAGGS